MVKVVFMAPFGVIFLGERGHFFASMACWLIKPLDSKGGLWLGFAVVCFREFAELE